MVRSPVQEAFDSLAENATGGFLETATVEYFQEQYCGTPAANWNCAAFPLLVEDCSVFPETTVLTAGHDPLRDEGQAFATRLDDAGVAVDHRNVADQPHVFVLFADRIETAQETIEWIGERLATVLQ
jgi:acetyl esterase